MNSIKCYSSEDHTIEVEDRGFSEGFQFIILSHLGEYLGSILLENGPSEEIASFIQRRRHHHPDVEKFIHILKSLETSTNLEGDELHHASIELLKDLEIQ